jgi:hypothetical protein
VSARENKIGALHSEHDQGGDKDFGYCDSGFEPQGALVNPNTSNWPRVFVESVGSIVPR